MLPTTETLPDGEHIDALSPSDACIAMLNAQRNAVTAIDTALPYLTQGADAMATAIGSGHALVYAAAGSSGLMALADASELAGTFGIPPSLVRIFMAGGVPTDGRMPGDTEDSTADVSLALKDVSTGDVVIVLSASGTTPYAIAIAQAAKAKDATVIAIANNPNTKLLELADIPICLETPPEIIAGSTRLGAGTAQKVALNTMSSMMGVQLGHVFNGRMVNVIADNIKLRARAAGIVAQVAKASSARAQTALDQANGNTKLAILLASGCEALTAQELLSTHKGHLGPCLQALEFNQTTSSNKGEKND
ncbi:MAG: N-acetylmuramic acid 6-phosphate etherase [Aliishimia sp.]